MAILSYTGFVSSLASAKASGKTYINKQGEKVKEYAESFLSGFGGYGWKIWQRIAGKWCMEIDDIVVRNTTTTYGTLKFIDADDKPTSCIYPDGTAELGNGASAFMSDKSGYIAGGAIAWRWDETENKYVCTLSDEIKEDLKSESVGYVITLESGFFVIDPDGNVGMKYDADGFDAAKLSEHFKTLIPVTSGGAVVSGGGVATTSEPGFFVVDSNGSVGMKYDSNGFDVAKLSEHFKALLPKSSDSGQGESKEDFDHLTFTDLYMVDNKYLQNQIIPVLQSERFTKCTTESVNNSITKKYYPLLDSGHTALPAIGQLDEPLLSSGTTKDIPLQVIVGCEDNSQDYKVEYTLHKTYSEAVAKQIRLLCISDSYGANQGRDLAYPEYSFFSYAQKLGMTDAAFRNQENRYITLGTTGYCWSGWGQWTANGKELTLVSHSEGRGGWTASTYARHVICTTNYRGLWYVLGLHKTYGEYDSYPGTERTKMTHRVASKLIDTSYIANEDAFKVAFNGEPKVSWNNGSTEAKQAAVDHYNSLVRGDITDGRNPFFNVNKPGDIKFDLQYYLDCWKTHRDDGVTQLTVGSTAGSKVTNINQNICVCTPTHICILLGTNDVSVFNDPDKLYADMVAIGKACTAISGVKVSLVFPAGPGSLYPERHSGTILGSTWETHISSKWENFKAMQALWENDNSINKNSIYWLPTFVCTETAESSPGSLSTTDPNGTPVKVIKKDTVHLGITGHRDIGYQIYAWTYYSSLK